MGDYTTRRATPHYVNPKTVVVRWLAGESEGRTWAIREFIYLNIKARQAHGQDYYEAPAQIATRLGNGVTTEDVHAATKRSPLIVRTGTDGDRRRQWVICTNPQERARITSVRKPQPPQRRLAAPSVPCGSSGFVGVTNAPKKGGGSLDETSSLLDKSSSTVPPKWLDETSRQQRITPLHPPFKNKKGITAPVGAGSQSFRDWNKDGTGNWNGNEDGNEDDSQPLPAGGPSTASRSNPSSVHAPLAPVAAPVALSAPAPGPARQRLRLLSTTGPADESTIERLDRLQRVTTTILHLDGMDGIWRACGSPTDSSGMSVAVRRIRSEGGYPASLIDSWHLWRAMTDCEREECRRGARGDQAGC